MMPTYKYEAMDPTGMEFTDTIEADTPEEAQAKIRSNGFFVTRIQRDSSCDAVASPRKEEEEQRELCSRYPGYGSSILSWIRNTLWNIPMSLLVGGVLACVCYFIAKLCVIDVTFWGTQRWVIVIVFCASATFDTFRCLVFKPLGILVYAKDWGVSYRMAQAAIDDGIAKKYNKKELKQMEAGDISMFLSRKRMATTITDAVMDRL